MIPLINVNFINGLGLIIIYNLMLWLFLFIYLMFGNTILFYYYSITIVLFTIHTT